MSEQCLGPGNGLGDYALVLLVYAALFVIMRFAHDHVDLKFRRT